MSRYAVWRCLVSSSAPFCKELFLHLQGLLRQRRSWKNIRKTVQAALDWSKTSNSRWSGANTICREYWRIFRVCSDQIFSIKNVCLGHDKVRPCANDCFQFSTRAKHFSDSSVVKLWLHRPNIDFSVIFSLVYLCILRRLEKDINWQCVLPVRFIFRKR